MAHLIADLRFALRSLRKVPLFTSVAVLSIAFGITANTAVFTLVDQVLLRPLPVDRPSELVQVDAAGTESHGGGMGDGTELSYAMYKDLRDHNDVFAGMFCRFSVTLQVSGAAGNDRVVGQLVSGTFFPVLGVTPAAGRLLTADDDATARPVAVLGYGYWQSRFHGDPGVVGRAVTVNGHPYEIAGVTRPGFNGLDIAQPPAVYLPITMQPQIGPSWLKLDGRRFRWVQVFARLRPHVTAAQAQAELLPLYRTVLQQEAADREFGSASADAREHFLNGVLHVTSAVHGHSGLRQSVTEPLLILMCVAAGVVPQRCATASARGSSAPWGCRCSLAVNSTSTTIASSAALSHGRLLSLL
jgi:hypothetical protein